MTYAEHIYRRLQGDVESAKMEATYWRNKFEAALKLMAESAHLQANPPLKLLAHAESFNAGKAMAEAADRERIAALVEQMGIDGYGTLAIAAAIRKGQP
jgi:hypothetical protein